MDSLGQDGLSESECETVFVRLFPQGFAGEDVLAELAPEGWSRSPLLSVFHPSVEQVYRETLRLHRNLAALQRPGAEGPVEPEPTLESVRRTWRDRPINAHREAHELVAMCLWDVFSDNHTVVSPDGRVVDIGSFRGAAGFLADLLNRETGSGGYDYMDFYMGSLLRRGRADLTPVYATIFRRLAAQGYDWEYVFPRLYAFDLGPLREELGLEREAAAGGPSEEEEERNQEVVRIAETLEEAHREALEEARDRPPPETVRAYREVYGWFPRGWPPWE